MQTTPPQPQSLTSNLAPLKSRLGCKTCKIRKLKCGQEKPSCRRCLSANFKCEYSTASNTSYASAPTTRSILDLPVSTSPNTVWRERRAFAYYFEHAAPYLASGLDREFWGTIVPRFCRVDTAIWDAVNAISTLFESPEMCFDFVYLSLRHEKMPYLTPKQNDALGWYARSLAKIRTAIDSGGVDVQVALVSCVLFVCIETLQGHVEEALKLYEQGIRLILGMRGNRDLPMLEGTIIPLFIRLGTAALTISGTPVCDLFTGFDIGGLYIFSSLEGARDALIQLAAEVQILERETGTNPFIGLSPEITPEAIAKRDLLQVRLGCWFSAYTEYAQTIRPQSPAATANKTITALLLTYHATLSTMLSTCLSRNHSIYDQHIPAFRTIVQQAAIALEESTNPEGSQPAFTFEQGIGPPLTWTALVCREPTIRRQALVLLQKAPPLQGFYKCGPGLALGSKIMALEESFSRDLLHNKLEPSLKSPSCMEDVTIDLKVEDIPEEARIRHYAVFRPRDQPHILGFHDVQQWKMGPEKLFMRFTRAKWDPGSGVWGLSDEIVPMG